LKRARLIYNPTSGKRVIKKFLPDLLNQLENFGYEASAFATTPDLDSAKNEAARVAEKNFDLIVVAGGDGTINEVVNGVAPLKYRPQIAIIPSGTTNDYARALKLPRNNPLAAINILKKQQTIKMDIGQAIDRYFINIAAGGGLSELTFQVPSELKTVFGYLAYLVKGAEMLPRIKPVNLRITYDDGIYEGLTSMFFVSLTNSVGGFEAIAPDSRLDDGKFTLIIIKNANLFEILRIMAKALNGGRHLADPKIIYKKTNQLNVEPLDQNQLMINLDGDYGGNAPIKLVNLQQHLEFFANIDAINDRSLLGFKDEYQQIANNYVQELETVIHEDLNGDGKIGKDSEN
jgi:diacylglycerol kinase (ATP)